MDNITKLIFGLFLITMFLSSILFYFMVINPNNLSKIKCIEYKCNDYYSGKLYPEQCGNFFINKTGNYCEGILVCENYLC